LCWGYIVAFTKVLTIYQMYHTWIHSLPNFPLSPPPSLYWICFFMPLICTSSSTPMIHRFDLLMVSQRSSILFILFNFFFLYLCLNF
jgi:hypothetical protein